MTPCSLFTQSGIVTSAGKNASRANCGSCKEKNRSGHCSRLAGAGLVRRRCVPDLPALTEDEQDYEKRETLSVSLSWPRQTPSSRMGTGNSRVAVPLPPCHRRPFTVTPGARPEAGSLDGPTMSKSGAGPIIAQIGRGRIAGGARRGSPPVWHGFHGGFCPARGGLKTGACHPPFSPVFAVGASPLIRPSGTFSLKGRRAGAPPPLIATPLLPRREKVASAQRWTDEGVRAQGAGRGGIGNSSDLMDAWLEEVGACHDLFSGLSLHWNACNKGLWG